MKLCIFNWIQREIAMCWYIWLYTVQKMYQSKNKWVLYVNVCILHLSSMFNHMPKCLCHSSNFRFEKCLLSKCLHLRAQQTAPWCHWNKNYKVKTMPSLFNFSLFVPFFFVPSVLVSTFPWGMRRLTEPSERMGNVSARPKSPAIAGGCSDQV